MANSAVLAITSLVSNKREWNDFYWIEFSTTHKSSVCFQPKVNLVLQHLGKPFSIQVDATYELITGAEWITQTTRNAISEVWNFIIPNIFALFLELTLLTTIRLHYFSEFFSLSRECSLTLTSLIEHNAMMTLKCLWKLTSTPHVIFEMTVVSSRNLLR